jgi:hypothetical protein
MFDFDVVTGPPNPTSLAKPAAPPRAKPLTALPPTAAATAMRDDGRGAERPAVDPGGSNP